MQADSVITEKVGFVCVGAIGLAGKNVNTIFGHIAVALTPSA